MATTDQTLGIRERATEHIVAQLVRLFERADEFGVSLHDCFDEAEALFLETADENAGEGSTADGAH